MTKDRSWLEDAPSVINTLGNTPPVILGILGLIEAKPLAASQMATAQKIADTIKADLANLETLVSAYRSNPTPPALAEIKTVAGTIKAAFSSMVANSGISDPALVEEVNELVRVAIDQLDAWESLFPALSGAVKAMTNVTITIPRSEVEYQEALLAVISKPRHDPNVDAANTAFLEKNPNVFA